MSHPVQVPNGNRRDKGGLWPPQISPDSIYWVFYQVLKQLKWFQHYPFRPSPECDIQTTYAVARTDSYEIVVQGGAYVLGRFSSLKDLKSDPKQMPHPVWMTKSDSELIFRFTASLVMVLGALRVNLKCNYIHTLIFSMVFFLILYWLWDLTSPSHVSNGLR